MSKCQFQSARHIAAAFLIHAQKCSSAHARTFVHIPYRLLDDVAISDTSIPVDIASPPTVTRFPSQFPPAILFAAVTQNASPHSAQSSFTVTAAITGIAIVTTASITAIPRALGYVRSASITSPAHAPAESYPEKFHSADATSSPTCGCSTREPHTAGSVCAKPRPASSTKGRVTTRESPTEAHPTRSIPRRLMVVQSVSMVRERVWRTKASIGTSRAMYCENSTGYSALSMKVLTSEIQPAWNAQNRPNAACTHTTTPPSSGYSAESSAVISACGTLNTSGVIKSAAIAKSGPPAATRGSRP
mmetsp:Transcript_5873/g.14316  ORF Transcript_5873/g.14316 Transcript_5873/m.14316 type:complete len:303 (+) Transcript_5873:96-1004(+)